jgi:crotonobetainyl-CoA:carnitine CoA-transferase CaiB-like acyl-CoA transferase
MSNMPLAGLRVLDATSNIAGPYGGAILADLGAEVIKIENPAGDPSRSMAPLDGDRSAYFTIVNRNKELLEINLKSAQGRETLDELLATVDIFLTNFLPDRLTKLQLDPAAVMARHPKLIFGNLTSYGTRGADAATPGYDATIQARTGIMFVTGEPDGQPVRAGVSVLDVGAGMWLAMGILAALVERGKSGKGSLVETSLYETGIAWVSYHLAANQISHESSVRAGAGHPTFSPYGIFETEEGKICIGVGSDAVFSKLCHTIQRKDLIANPLYARNVGRVANRAELHREIESALSGKSANVWAKKLGLAGVPADLVVPPEALFNDPQQLEVGMLLQNPDINSEVKLIPGIPIKVDGQRPTIRKTAPHRFTSGDNG